VAKQVVCTCGFKFSGETDDELWAKAKQHLADAHPEMLNQVTREDIVAQAELI
jgi:predicted small metal-binding protein